jgi:hypothetical protein
LLEVFRELHNGGDAEFCAAVAMPDHVHLLFTLGDRLRLCQVVAKLKSLARDRGHVSWRWQENVFEHQLRSGESLEDYGFYVFMNPYRGDLCPMDERWPWWFCPQPGRFRFMSMLNAHGTPPKEWLAETERLAGIIEAGE